MKALYNAALVWLVLGLVSGVFYREYTKFHDFEGVTQLSTLHTHMLVLGMLVMLLVLALERLFELSRHRNFKGFFWIYNGGLALTVTLMVVRGLMQVAGVEGSAAISGIAGLGHIILSIGLALFFQVLGSRISVINRREAQAEAEALTA